MKDIPTPANATALNTSAPVNPFGDSLGSRGKQTARLRDLRAQSAYPATRFVVSIGFLVGMVASTLMMSMGIFKVLQGPNLTSFLPLGIGAFLMFLTILWRESISLLVDIADSNIAKS